MSTITPTLITQFAPLATACTENRLTMLQNKAFEIWNNEPFPVPGTTFSDCYPSQFISSLISSAGGITLQAFSPLECPKNYSTVGFTSNYIACCPRSVFIKRTLCNIAHLYLSGYSLANPTATPFSNRPAFGGTCYTPLFEGTPVTITKYGTGSVLATTTFAATDQFAQAYAYPYEGFASSASPIISAKTTTFTSGIAAGVGSNTGTSIASTSISQSTSSGSMKTGAIAAILVVISIVVVSSTVGLFFFMRRRKRFPAVSELPAENQMKDNLGQARDYYGQGDLKISLSQSRDRMSVRKGGLRVATELPGYEPAELPGERWSHYNKQELPIQELESPVSPP